MLVLGGIAAVLAGARLYLWITDPTRGVPGFDPDREPRGGALGDAACLHCHETVAPGHGAGGRPSVEVRPRLEAGPATDPEGPWQIRPGSPTRLCRGDDECLEVALAVGSGVHRRAFLLRDGAGGWLRWDREQTPDGWVGPGVHYEALGARHDLGRRLEPEHVARCLACHAPGRGNGTSTPPELDALVPEFECEGCHGPGWQHVVRVGEGDPKPGPLGPYGGSGYGSVRACGRCHGNPEAVPVYHVVAAAPITATLPATGILMSACLASGDGPTCTACHTPHGTDRPAGTKRARDTCLTCHAVGGARTRATCVEEPDGDCLDCHMPRLAAGETTHRREYVDHGIRVRQRDPGPTTLSSDRLVQVRLLRLKDLLTRIAEETGHKGGAGGRALLRLATVQSMTGDPDGAAKLLKEAAELLPDEPAVFYNLGNIYLLMGVQKTEAARDALSEALRIDPEHLMARIQLAEVFRRGAFFDQAERELRRALGSHPGHPRALRELGAVLVSRGRTVEAIATLEQALAARPDYRAARRDLAVALQKVERYRDALAHWRRLVEEDPNDPEAVAALDFLEQFLARRSPPGGGTP